MDLAEFIDDLFEEATLPSATAGWMGVGSTKIALELAHLPGHPAHAIARRHKREREAWLSRELCARHVGDSADIARDIMLLLEGCLLLALIHGDRTYAARAAGAAKLLTTAACTPAFTPPPANTALVR